jgi:hypothetical protein
MEAIPGATAKKLTKLVNDHTPAILEPGAVVYPYAFTTTELTPESTRRLAKAASSHLLF